MKTLYVYGTVYNNRDIIEKSISSLYPLTKQFKLYFSIIDNFSSDGTYQWLISNSNKYKNMTFNIKQVKCNRGKGRSLALNQILKVANPNSFTFYIDFDTIYLPRYLDYIIDFVSHKYRNKIGIGHLSLVKYNYKVGWKSLNYGEDVERTAHFRLDGYKIDMIQHEDYSFAINQDRGNSAKEREAHYDKGLRYYIRIFFNAVDMERGWAFPNFHEFYNVSKIKSKSRYIIFMLAYLVANIEGIYRYSKKENNWDFFRRQ